ncbi:MAG: hypothetical protein IKW60_04720 [Clostridia bacterium]|nr:hypothetical protein [Clostridia bacterium]
MKRLMSLLLIATMLLSFGMVSHAASLEQDINVYHYNLLKELKIVDKALIKEYDPFADVSKSAFINYICNIIGDYGYDNTYNQAAISMLEGNGVIHPGQDDLTKPLYLDEAITMLVRLLGYEKHAQMAGGYPSGYLLLANRLGLSDGLAVNPGERLKESNMVTLLYNAINACYVEIIAINDKDGIIYGNTSDKTLMYEYKKVYRVEGIVETAGGISTKAYSNLAPDKIMIDGYVYDSAYDYSEFLGMRVEAYVRENNLGTDTLIAAAAYNNEMLEISGKYITGPANNYTRLSYTDQNNNEKSVEISPVAPVIYNGQLYSGSYTDAMFKPVDGKVVLVDNAVGNQYETVFIEDYQTLIVDGISTNNEIVKNVYTKTGETSISYKQESEMDNIRLFDGEKEIDFSALTPGDVVRYTKSVVDGRTVLKAYKSNNKITGTVTTIRQYDGETLVSVGDMDYPEAPVYISARANSDTKAMEIKAGGRYTFYLDDLGRIVYVAKAQDVAQYGIVIAKGVGSGVFNREQSLKLFTTEGTIEALTLADKVELNDANGVTTKDTAATQVGKFLAGTDDAITVISYRLNSEGEICKIDLPDTYNDGNNGEFNGVTNQKVEYRTGNHSFNSDYFVDSNPVIWAVDGNKGEEESYSKIAQSELMNDHEYKYNCYNIDEFHFANLFVIVDSTANGITQQTSAPMLVQEIATTMDADGNEVYMITGMMGEYDALSFLCEDKTLADSIKPGDTISAKLDGKGYLIDKTIHCALDATRWTYTAPSNLRGNGIMFVGTVEKTDVIGNRMKLKGVDNVDRYIRTTANVPIAIWDKESGKTIRGTLGDIEIGDLIVTKMNYFNLKGIVVYR